jgi:dTDP-4-amino-4,6-dideoxygalactose transaminase
MNEAIGKVPFLDLPAQHAALRPDLERVFSRLISDCDFILGRAVADFERSFSAFVGARHGVGVANGLDALRLALQACGVGAGDEVILPANTFIATALAVSQLGARVVLVDCDAATYSIDPARIESAITSRTKAVIPVHLTGQAAEMDEVIRIARRRRLAVVEDAAQAHGARYKGRPCGSMGDAGCFSFYPGKNLGACGDAGMVTTQSDELAARLRRLRNCGQEAKYVHVDLGCNSRLDTLQAEILSLKLARLAEWNAARAWHAERYRQLLRGVGDLRFQARASHSDHVYHLFVIETARRDELRQHLSERGIDTLIHYPVPIHLQKAYAHLGYARGAFPAAERLAATMLSLPMFAELNDAAIERVAASVRGFFQA